MKPHRHPVPAPTLRDDAEHGDTWRDRAACKDCDDPEVFFPGRGDTPAEAKAICRTCPVIEQCLTWALENNPQGIWGGTTEDDRRNFKRKAMPSENRSRPIKCGTTRGYWRHNRANEDACRPCKDAIADYWAERRARKAS